MRAWLIAAALALTPVLVHSAPRLEIRGFAGRVAIIPEARSDISVAVVRKTAAPMKVRQSGDLTVIEGGFEHRIKGCPLIDGELRVRITGLGFLSQGELPVLAIRTPRDVRISAGDGVSGVVGRTETLNLENHGCGDWTIANVRGALRLTQVGGGHIIAGSAGRSDLSVAGGGAISVRSIAGMATAVSTGEGLIRITDVDGPVVARVAGSGAIAIAGGGAPELNAQVAGSGTVRFGGSAGAVTALVAGQGEIDVAHVSGPLTRRIMGPGRIRAGGAGS